jgi:AraC-like DNA-binding protein
VLVESPILCMHEYVRTIRGGRVSGAHVELRHPPTVYAGHYARYFECPVHFDAPRNAMVFPEDWRLTPNAGHDPAGFRMALRQCAQDASAREEDLLLSVRRSVQTWIDERVDGGAPPALQALAARLHVSPRTLVRRLGNAGTTYQAMLDEIQFERARQLLAGSDWRLAGIARELGFHDAASFTRSFKRWSGMTPGHYRASLLAAA